MKYAASDSPESGDRAGRALLPHDAGRDDGPHRCDTTFEPDALVYGGPPIDLDAIEVPDPVIVVDVQSPGSKSVDTGTKLIRYFRVTSVGALSDPRSGRNASHPSSPRGEGGLIETRIATEGTPRSEPARPEPAGRRTVRRSRRPPRPELDPIRGGCHSGANANQDARMTTSLDLLVLGNAIVDVIARTDDAFLSAQGVTKGAMQLIDEARAETLFHAMGPATIVSGGSGRQHGGRRGPARRPDRLRRQGPGRRARRPVQPRSEGHRRRLHRSGGERGAGHGPLLRAGDAGRRAHDEHLSRRLPGADPPPMSSQALVSSARVVYLEGYLWDPPAAKDAFRKARPGRPSGRQRRRADPVGRVLRRPLPRRVPGPHPRRQHRHPVRQHRRAAEPLPDRRSRGRRGGAARRAQRPRPAPARPRDPLGRRRPGGAGRGGPRRRGEPGGDGGRHDGGRRPVRRRVPGRARPRSRQRHQRAPGHARGRRGDPAHRRPPQADLVSLAKAHGLL